MGYELPKRLLRQASTFELRQKAIRAAMGLGMPLSEIEEYLDWLDTQPQSEPPPANQPNRAGDQKTDRDDQPCIPPPHASQHDAKEA